MCTDLIRSDCFHKENGCGVPVGGMMKYLMIIMDLETFQTSSQLLKYLELLNSMRISKHFETILHFRNLHSLEGAIILFFRRYIYKVDLFYIFSN